jgi:hypothetical protein
MGNVIDFKTKEKVFELEFKCPAVIKFNKTGQENIRVELADGVGKAWVMASNKLEAKKRLHTMMSITEWLNDE